MTSTRVIKYPIWFSSSSTYSSLSKALKHASIVFMLVEGTNEEFEFLQPLRLTDPKAKVRLNKEGISEKEGGRPNAVKSKKKVDLFKPRLISLASGLENEGYERMSWSQVYSTHVMLYKS